MLLLATPGSACYDYEVIAEQMRLVATRTLQYLCVQRQYCALHKVRRGQSTHELRQNLGILFPESSKDALAADGVHVEQ